MADPGLAIAIMAIVFGIHIVLINIDLGLGIIIPILKRIGEIRGNEVYVSEARKYMRYFAIVYASAGVFGTAFTVFLLTFFPEFLWLGGVLLIVPFGLAVVFLILRLFSIGAYWYTWDKLRGDYHFYLGLVLAFTSFAVPYAFRSVFAFLNYPAGVESISPLKLNPIKMLTNPTLMPIYLKSVAGGVLAATFSLVSLYAYKVRKGESDKETASGFIKKYLNVGMWLLGLQVIFGFWYLASLSMYAPYKFGNIVGVWFGRSVSADYSWLFTIKMLLVAYQFFVVFYIAFTSIQGKEFDVADDTTNKLLLGLGPAALLVIMFGEFLNAFSQLPYFVAQPALEEALPMINVYNSINELASVLDIYAIAFFAFIPLFLAFFVLLYYILAGKVSNGGEY